MSAASSRGVAVMICGTALLIGNDAASKYLTETFPVGQVICLRQAAALLAMVRGELPDPWIMAGGAVIVAAGILMLRSETPLHGRAIPALDAAVRKRG